MVFSYEAVNIHYLIVFPWVFENKILLDSSAIFNPVHLANLHLFSAEDGHAGGDVPEGGGREEVGVSHEDREDLQGKEVWLSWGEGMGKGEWN